MTIVDINFDGYDDLKIWTATSAGPNMGYDYWLYDDKSGQFMPSDIGDKLSGFDVIANPETKTISTTVRGGPSWFSATYRWFNKKPIIMQVMENGNVYFRGILPLKEEDETLCGIQTDEFNEDEKLISTDIVTPGDFCKKADTNKMKLLISPVLCSNLT